MGMSSSQARLLNLTARMHQIEYKAARLEAQKLQMANESARVYDNYLNALEALKTQAFVMTADGSKVAKDLTLNIIEGNVNIGLDKSFYLKDPKTNKVYITSALVDKYNLDGSGELPESKADFMTNAGFEFIYTRFDNIPNGNETIRYTGIANTVVNGNTRQVPDRPADVGFQDSIFGQADVSGLSMASAVAANSFVSGGTYVINNADELVQLANLVNYGANTQNVTFVLNSDIDMSGVSDWHGIGYITGPSSYPQNTVGTAFQGTFDGNYHKITGLNGNQGLFDYAREATIKNLQVTDVSVYHKSASTRTITTSTGNKTVAAETEVGAGALIGTGVCCNIENVYVSGSYNSATGRGGVVSKKWSGGAVGNSYSNRITNVTSAVDVNCDQWCIGGFVGHDASGILTNCLATGSVTASSDPGGFIGHETNGGSGSMTNCVATGTVTGSGRGSFIGRIDGGSSVNLSGCQYAAQSGVNPIGNGGSYAGEGTLTPGGYRTVTTANISLPQKTAMASNIVVAMEKGGLVADAPFVAQMNAWLDRIYSPNMAYYTPGEANPVLSDEALMLARVNTALVGYLEDGSNPGVVAAIVQDIIDMDLSPSSATAPYQIGYESPNFDYTPYGNGTGGTAVKWADITTGSVRNIANNLYTAFRKLGHVDLIKESLVKNWLEARYPSNYNNDLELLEINNQVTKWLTGATNDTTEIENLYNAFASSTKYTIPSAKKIYTTSNATYNITFEDREQPGDEDFDMNNPDVVEAIRFYDSAKDGGYVLVDDTLADSNVWFTNVLNDGFAVLHEIDRAKGTDFETSVATNTSLQEVTDEAQLRKVEAQYEADMKRIDRKDSRYDTELAALDTERNAIKQEIETLKTVAKDNVERTFKLFG